MRMRRGRRGGARGARGRIAGARTPRRRWRRGRGLADPRRPARRAGAGGRAHAQRRSRGRSSGRRCGRASRRSDLRAPAAFRDASLSPASPRPRWRPSRRCRRLRLRLARPRFQAALAPTALAPGASGEATLTKTSSGWRIHLHATGLPRLEGTRFYEAWLLNSAGVLVPIGTFNEGRDVTLWAGVSPASFTVLTVTRERADGDQASSGEKVLVGPVRPG